MIKYSLFLFMLVSYVTNTYCYENLDFSYDSVSKILLINTVTNDLQLKDYLEINQNVKKDERINILSDKFNNEFVDNIDFNDSMIKKSKIKEYHTNAPQRSENDRIFWYRIKIASSSLKKLNLVLNIWSYSPTAYNTEPIEYFEVMNNQIIEHKITGYYISQDLKDIVKRLPNVSFMINPNDTLIIYLKSEEFRILPSITDAKTEYNSTLKSVVIMMPVLTIFFITIIIVLFYWINNRDKIYLYYSFYIFSLFYMLSTITEMLIYFLPIQIFKFLEVNNVSNLILPLIFISSTLFLKSFLEIPKNFRKWNLYFNITIWIALADFIIFIFSENIGGLLAFILGGLYVFNLFSFVILSFLLWKRKMKMAIFVLIGWGLILVILFLLLISVLLGLFSNINLLRVVHPTIPIVSIFLFELLVFLYGLSYRSKLLKQDNLKLEQDNLITNKEKEITEKLLLNILPLSIAKRLRSGETKISDYFDEASVIFIDIVDFTKISEKLHSQRTVEMLNEIYLIFDEIASKYGIEKIKTIGDCYMAASGIPIPRKDHALAITQMAVEVLNIMKNFGISYQNESGEIETISINIRIGIDCGPIVAGVIGSQKFIYDLWGDTVNTASRMESNGYEGKIQVTDRFKEKIINMDKQNNQFENPIFEKRGDIEIKGKGTMRTWWLVGNE